MRTHRTRTAGLSHLRKAAKGRDCTLEIHPYCNQNPETVVLCHAPSEDKGMGTKSPDWWAAYGCSDCHDIIDGRRKTELSQHEIDRCINRGVYRTLKTVIDENLL